MSSSRRSGTTKGKRNDRQPRIEVISVESARKLLDRRARRLLGISGEEFLRRVNAGEVDYERPGVFALATLADLVRT